MSHVRSKLGPVEFQRFSERRTAKAIISAPLLRAIRVKALGKINGLQNWLVRGEKIRNLLDVDFCMGSHFAHSRFIPMGEVWMEASLSPADLTALIVHEGTEVEWMVKKGWDYETAHDRSSCFERALRLRLERGELPVRTRGQAVAVAKQVLTTILSRP